MGLVFCGKKPTTDLALGLAFLRQRIANGLGNGTLGRRKAPSEAQRTTKQPESRAMFRWTCTHRAHRGLTFCRSRLKIRTVYRITIYCSNPVRQKRIRVAGEYRTSMLVQEDSMLCPQHPLVRGMLVSASALALFIAGCQKKQVAAKPPAPGPTPAVKPSATFSADHATINQGESVQLSWNTSDATTASISPGVGGVSLQGSTSVTPSVSTTYTLTASGAGGSAESSVRIFVNAPAPVAAHEPSPAEMFLKEVNDAYFDYNSASIRSDAQTALHKSAVFLKGYPSAHVTVEGHCDERGSTEYNLALGQRRAEAVKQYLESLGVPADQIATMSWGKERPFCTQESESCWQENRRGHFSLNK
jgi:peptidoglycan-associated lipoprotein